MGDASRRRRLGVVRQSVDRRLEEALWKARWDTQFWYPTAADLALPYVPTGERESIRKLIGPRIENMKHAMTITHEDEESVKESPRVAIQGGHCWEVAQSFVLTAQDPRVRYVEGVWTRPWHLDNPDYPDHLPAPHAWFTVEGHRVCLVGEFYNWRSSGDDGDWLYEPLKDYSHEDLIALFDYEKGEGIFAEGFDITSYLWSRERDFNEDYLPNHLKSEKEPKFETQVQPPSERYPNGLWGTKEEHEAYDKWQNARDEYENRVVFKPAMDRLIERHRSRIAA